MNTLQFFAGWSMVIAGFIMMVTSVAFTTVIDKPTAEPHEIQKLKNDNEHLKALIEIHKRSIEWRDKHIQDQRELIDKVNKQNAQLIFRNN